MQHPIISPVKSLSSMVFPSGYGFDHRPQRQQRVTEIF